MNALVVTVNIPITGYLSYSNGDDPYYLLELVLMIWVKVALSAISAKVCQNLNNPRYAKNQAKLNKIKKRQREKIIKREAILGKDTVDLLEGIAPESVEHEDVLDIDTDRLRDKLLEK